MTGTPRSAFGKLMIGTGRRAGVAPAAARLHGELAGITARQDTTDRAALAALCDRARAVLAETLALAGTSATVKDAHDTLAAALVPLERRLGSAVPAARQAAQDGRPSPWPPAASRPPCATTDTAGRKQRLRELAADHSGGRDQRLRDLAAGRPGGRRAGQ